MNYQSPIELIMEQINLSLEGEICKAVQKVGINVDKDELTKALQYDRGQYQKGYNDRDKELVRCRECRFKTVTDSPSWDYWCKRNERNVDEDDFCSDGELI